VTAIKSRISDFKPQIALAVTWLLILTFIVTFSALSLRRHAALASNGMDLGNVDQALWNTAHGHFLAFTNMAPVRNRLALHVEPILLLFVPLYWIGLGGPKLLLIVQAVVVGLGALPLYWLAREVLVGSMEYGVGSTDYAVRNTQPVLLPSLLPIVFPLAYLLLPALEAAVMYDFHAVTLAPTFLLFALYWSEKERLALFALFAGLAMACKEDMGLTVAMLGVYLIVSRRRWRRGAASVAAGVAWLAIAVFLVQPRFSPTGANIQADRYAWLGATPLSMLSTILRHPGMVWAHVWRQADLAGYLTGLLVPTAFLSVLAPLAWLPTLPSLAINLLSDDPFTWRLEDFHYAAPIAPFVLVAALYGVQRLGGWVGRRRAVGQRYAVLVAGSFLLVASATYHYARGFSPLAQPFTRAGGKPVEMWPVDEHDRRAEAIFAQVPASAAVFAQSNLNPHLSSRQVLYQDPAVLTDPEVRDGLPAPDYVLFDVSSLVNQDDFQRFIASELVGQDTFGPVLAEDGFLLLERGAPPTVLPDGFFDFARGSPDTISHPLMADFGDALRLRGFDLIFNRAEDVQPVLYFEALRPLQEDYFIAVYLLDEWGTPLGATLEDQPALVWYPTHRWQVGELVKVTFNTLPWYTRDLAAYRLAVGVMQGRDPWQPAARLSPGLEAETDAHYAVRLPDDGTLLELARLRRSSILGIAEVRPVGGPVEREFRSPRPDAQLNIWLGDEIRLLGYDLALADCEVPETGQASQSGGYQPAPQSSNPVNCGLQLVLYWQAHKPISENYTVFVHVIGPDGRIVAQRDTPPDGGAYPTRRWAVGEVVADRVQVALPGKLPAGPLQVLVGMYHPDTGQRLPVLDAQGRPTDDKVLLKQISVKH
jgi:uncharacterized membrane protein